MLYYAMLRYAMLYYATVHLPMEKDETVAVLNKAALLQIYT